jgi:chromosomal replication initiator protein
VIFSPLSHIKGKTLIFDKIKFSLKKSEDSDIYNKYIKNLKLDEKNSTSNHLIIETPNIYIATYVKRYYTQKFINIYQKLTEIIPEIEFITNQNRTVKNSFEESIQKEISKSIATLIPEFTFETFVTGPSNLFACNTAKAIAKSPGTLYNPMFIYGGVGLGKTHLLHAIGNKLKSSLKVTYVTSEQFMNDFTYNVRNKTMDNFHKKYRECDLLIIDDIQFFEGREKTQEEFFHTFNELIANKKQICVTADRHPKNILGIDKRLSSRFEQGLITEIQPPELETKIAIIRKKCELNNINLPEDVITFIATTLNNNIREIEGMITQTYAMANVLGEEISLDFTKEIFKDQIENKEIDLDIILTLISKEFNLKPSEVTTKSRKPAIVLAKRTGIYLARELTKKSTTNIAKFFGLKDHSAVSHAIKAFNKKIKEDKDFKLKIDELTNKLKSSS